jgi:hypothetical protein
MRARGKTTVRAIAALVTLVLAAGGCAGASVEVTAERARYPVSMSGLVRDGTGVIHGPWSLQRVGMLRTEATRFGFLYSTATAQPRYDISDEVNAQVAAARGEAVVNLSVTVSARCGKLNMFPFLGILPFWPGCVPVSIMGDIVRRWPAPAPAPTLAPPAPPSAPVSDASVTRDARR